MDSPSETVLAVDYYLSLDETFQDAGQMFNFGVGAGGVRHTLRRSMSRYAVRCTLYAVWCTFQGSKTLWSLKLRVSFLAAPPS